MKFPDSMTTPPVPASPEKSRIPVMFSATGGWGLPLGVAIHTLCLHASSGRFYDIHIVHDGMDARIIQELNQVAAPFPQVSLSFLQLPEEFRHLFQNGNKDRYSPLAYARLMAGSLFPQYGRIVYLDADVLLAGDVADMVGPEKPWRLPDTPGTMGQFHWILYSFFWWPEAKRLPAFREELDAISQGLAPLLQRHIRGQQWKLFFSRGHIFRKRRDKIRWLKKLLSILDGRKP